MTTPMTKHFTFILLLAGCSILIAAPAQAQSRQQQVRKTSAPAVSAKIVGKGTKAKAIRHPTASQRFPNPGALTVVTLSDGSKRLRRPDKAR